jgi:hypothetical protein
MAKLTEGLRPQARDHAAELALLTAPPPPRTPVPVVVVIDQPQQQPKREDEPEFKKLKPRVQQVVLDLEALENEGVNISMPKPALAALVAKRIGASVSVRTLGKAEKYRREHPRRPA